MQRYSDHTTAKAQPSIGQVSNQQGGVQQIISAACYASALHVATQLQLADLLHTGPKSVKELADLTRTHAPSLWRFLRALASIGIFSEGESEMFENTDQSSLLRADHPSGFYHMARLLGSNWNWQTWGAMLYSVQTGTPAFDHVYGMKIWEYFATKDPEGARIFDAAMTASSLITSLPIAKAYDFSTIQTISDIGGGQGLLLKTLLQTYPHLKGILVDRGPVLAQAREYLRGELENASYELIECDIFKGLPPALDVYLLKNVVHDWDDTHAISILSNCCSAMRHDSKLLLIEHVLQPGNTDALGQFLDLQMLLKVGGKERTEQEYCSLLNTAGLSLSCIIAVNKQISILEVVKKSL